MEIQWGFWVNDWFLFGKNDFSSNRVARWTSSKVGKSSAEAPLESRAVEMENGQQVLAEYLHLALSLQRPTTTRVKEPKSGSNGQKDWLSRPKKTESLAAMEKVEKHPGYQMDLPEDLGYQVLHCEPRNGWLKAYSRITSRSSAWFHVVKPLCTLWLRDMRGLLPRESKAGSWDWGTPSTSEDRHITLKMGIIRHQMLRTTAVSSLLPQETRCHFPEESDQPKEKI